MPQGLTAVADRPPVENFPYGLAKHLERIFGQPGLETDVLEHLCLLDLLSRYLLFIPLSYYIHLLRQSVGPSPLIDRGLCNYILDALGTRKGRGGSAGLTPFGAMEAGARIVEVLVQHKPSDPFVAAFASVHRRFSIYGGKGRRVKFAEEVENVFKRERDKVCHAHQLFSPSEKRSICQQWRDHLARWFDEPFFSQVMLAARSTSGENVSLMPFSDGWDGPPLETGSETFVFTTGTERLAFPAAPFLRLALDGGRPSLLILNAYEENASGDGTLKYTECELQEAQIDEGPRQGLRMFAERIYFPWLRAECRRELTRNLIIPGQLQRVSLHFENTGNEPMTVGAFLDVLPAGLTTDGGAHAASIGSLTLAPGGRAEPSYLVVAAEAFDGELHFKTRDVPIEQGGVAGRIPLSGTLALKCVAALPPNPRIHARLVSRWDGKYWVPLPSNAEVVTGEALQLQVRLENSGTDLDRLEYAELLPRDSGARILSATLQISDGTSAGKVEVTGTDRRQEVAFALDRPFAHGGALMLTYLLVPLRKGRLTIQGEVLHATFRGIPLDRIPVPPQFSLAVVEDASPTVEVRLLSVVPVGSNGRAERLGLCLDVINTSRQVVFDVTLRLKQREGPETAVRLPWLRGLSDFTLTLPVQIPSAGAWKFSLDSEFRSFRGQPILMADVLKQRSLPCVWRSPVEITGFHGRQDVSQDLWRELEARPFRPIFLEGEAGSGKMRLLKEYQRLETQSGRGIVVAEEPIACSTIPHQSKFRQLLSLMRALCARVAPAGASDPEREGLDALGISDGGEYRFLYQLFVDTDRYAQQRLGDSSLADDVYRFFLRFVNFRVQEVQTASASNGERVSLLIPVTSAGSLGADATSVLTTVCERLRANSNDKLFFLVLVDEQCPVEIAELVRKVVVRPWTEPEFTTVCNDCFVYPRLAKRTIALLYAYTRGNPLLSMLAIEHAQQEFAKFEVHAGEADLPERALPEHFFDAIKDELGTQFDKFLTDTRSHALKRELTDTLCLLNLADAAIGKDEVMSLLLRVFAQDNRDDRATALQRLGARGWIGALPNGYGPAPRLTMRKWASRLAPEPQRFYDLLFEHFVDADTTQSVLYMRRASDEMQRRHQDKVIDHAQARLSAGQLYDAQTMFSLLVEVKGLPPTQDLAVVHGIARVEWALGDRSRAAARKTRLRQAIEAEKNALTRRRTSPSPESTAMAGADRPASLRERKARLSDAARTLALLEAWDTLIDRERAAEGLRILQPFLWTGTLNRVWRRMRGWSRRGFVLEHLQHHLLGLEIAFMSCRVEAFVALSVQIEEAVEGTAFEHRASYLETLWRLAERPDRDAVIAATTAEPTEILGAISAPASPLLKFVDPGMLLQRTRVAYEGERDRLPRWASEFRYRQWKTTWADAVASAKPSEALVSDLDEVISEFRRIASANLVAQALCEKAEALLELARASSSDAPRYREQAYRLLVESADEYQKIGQEHAEATMLGSAVRERIVDISAEELLEIGPKLQRDVERACACLSLGQDVRMELSSLGIQLAWFNDDLDKAQKFLDGAPLLHAGLAVYLLHRREADFRFQQETAEGDARALDAIRVCLDSLDETVRLQEQPKSLEGLRGTRLDLNKERLLLSARMADVCFRGSQWDDALKYTGRVLDAIGAWLRGEPADVPRSPGIWAEIVPGCASAREVVLSLLKRCLSIWQKSDIPVRQRTPYFREHFLTPLGDLEVRSGRGARREKSDLLSSCWLVYQKSLSGPMEPLEEIDLALLETEVALLARREPPPSFADAATKLSMIDLDRQKSIDYVMASMERLLRLSLKYRRDLEPMMQGFAQVMTRERYGRPAIRALSRLALEVQRDIRAAMADDDLELQQYLESFSQLALKRLHDSAETTLDFDAFENLITLSLLIPGWRVDALHWVERLVDSARERQTAVEGETIGLLCGLISEHEEAQPMLAWAESLLASGGTSQLQDEIAALRASVDPVAEATRRERTTRGVALCQQLIQDSLSPESVIPFSTRRSLLFHVTEKVLSSHTGLQLLSGLALHRSGVSSEATNLKLIRDGVINQAKGLLPAADLVRLNCVLVLAELWFYDEGQRFNSGESVYIWNVLIKVDEWKSVFERLVHLADESDSPNEGRVLRALDLRFRINSRLWGTTVAQHVVKDWGAPEALGAQRSESAAKLARFLVTDVLGDEAPTSFMEAYVAMQTYVEGLSEKWHEELQQRTFSEYPVPATLHEHSEHMIRSEFVRLGLEFVEELAKMVTPMDVDEALGLVASTLDEKPAPFPPLETIPVERTLARYDELMARSGQLVMG